MTTIVLANQKGGVAKTTTAVNLAAGLARSGRRVLLVDMDPQANATDAILGAVALSATVYHLLIDAAGLDDVILETGQSGLHIIPSDIDLAGAEVELLQGVGGQNRLKVRLSGAQEYDYIIIDAPPSLGILTINALAAADEVYIPVNCGIFALKGMAKLQATIEAVRVNLGRSDLRVSGVLATLHDHTNVAKDVVNTIQKSFGPIVFQTTIPRNVKLEEAHSRSKNIFDYAPDSTGAQAYQQLVGEVLDRERQ